MIIVRQIDGHSTVIDTHTGEAWDVNQDHCIDCGAALSADRSVWLAVGPDCEAERLRVDPVWQMMQEQIRQDRRAERLQDLLRRRA